MSSKARLIGSIRFRLAAWYAVIVLAVLVAMGLMFSILLERELRSDVDGRLDSTAQRVKAEIERIALDERTGELAAIQSPPPDFYSFPSLLIQVVNASGGILISSENLYEANAAEARLLPTSETPDGSIEPAFRSAHLDGVQMRTVSLPLVLRGGETRRTIGAVNVGEPLIQLEQTLSHVRRLLVVGAALAVAFAAVVGWFLAGRALRPVDRITATAAAIAEGRGVGSALSARLPVGRSGDELERLAETFNRMLNRLQDTFESQRRFIADASHELRTPLTAIRGNVDVLSRQIGRGGIAGVDTNETLDDLRRESERMSRLIEELLLLARAEADPAEGGRRGVVQLEDVVAEAVRVGSVLTLGQRLVAETTAASVVADRDRLVQVLINLIDNAVRHTAQDGMVTVSTNIDHGRAVIEVTDTGIGIPPEHIPYLFDRFYRADSSRHRGSGGTGLGLAIARAIVESHRGTITVESTVGAGTTVTVSLPLADSPPQLPSSTSGPFVPAPSLPQSRTT